MLTKLFKLFNYLTETPPSWLCLGHKKSSYLFKIKKDISYSFHTAQFGSIDIII